MEPVDDERDQKKGSEGCENQFSPKCLRIGPILSKILSFCADSDLLQLSLVNKQWNYEARTVLKDRGTVSAHLDPRQPCQDLAVLASHLRQMNVVPYSGITVYFGQYEHEDNCSSKCETSQSETLDSSFDDVFDCLPFKHFGVGFSGSWEEYYECPAFLLVKKVLQDRCEVLERLRLDLQDNFEDFINLVQDSTFPNLKNLKLRCPPCGGGRLFKLEPEENFIKEMVSLTPNLHELRLDHPVAVHVYNYILEGSSAVIVVEWEIDPFNYGIRRHRLRDDDDGEIDPLMDGINGPLRGPFSRDDDDVVDPSNDRMMICRSTRRLFSGDLRLTRMRLEYTPLQYFTTETLNRFVPKVLQSSSTTLHSLSLDSIFAPCLMRFGISLENVTKLKIHHHDQSEVESPQWHLAAEVIAFLKILQDFDFTYIFPKLTDVKLRRSCHHLRPSEISHFVGQARNVTPQGPRPDRAIKIKHLRLKDYPLNIKFLVPMFPHIEKLSIKHWDESARSFRSIWKHWDHLKQLDVHAIEFWGESWDSWFCGIFPEEISQLREKDDEYLRAVNIVPIMPSITCMKELRTFTLTIPNHMDMYGKNHPMCIFSKVTALVAFSRCPNLSVTLQINSKLENAWSHMKEYASIIILEPENFSRKQRRFLAV